MKRNWEALVLKAMGGRDFRLTVRSTEPVGGHYQRLVMDDGGLLAAGKVHPTMWIRLWFDDAGRAHQRAYTLVDPEPEAGRFTLEFALHDGCAARWASTAQVGDTIVATLQGSAFALPDPAPAHLYLVGDAASLPAVNSLLDAAPDTPATIWLEYAHDGERALALRTREQHRVTWVPRGDDGRQLVDTVRAALPVAPDAHYWVACEATSTRALTRHVRRTLGMGKQQLTSLGYWSAR
ncbi:NADPH-dependent ferric siderophore reductase, contains FAD-binding and SIP domains [Micromonospora matsumotoense]|uniref:NADPH-dependent ferric siderophore reductase, contains FAD-binding and SIP domains n=1 Tax=Micromonospora matsumotoense TaxID=121616 RepID=A0A1C4VII8_9ACTN|nr:siderophore-interacting protein [Micromonospora matsumotoense]SCE83794.1 NADPH-dependent ferric siderophore reductase, contains FAD-binding and SIP domains [Micromonospora matsumotoense]